MASSIEFVYSIQIIFRCQDKLWEFSCCRGGKTAGEQRMKSEDEPILMDWSFLCVAACFADFFTAQVPWYTEDLSGPDMLWVSYLVAIGSIQEGP